MQLEMYPPCHYSTMKHLTIDPSKEAHATRDQPQGQALASSLPDAKETKVHPSKAGGGENASLLFVGTATTILYVQGHGTWPGAFIVIAPPCFSSRS